MSKEYWISSNQWDYYNLINKQFIEGVLTNKDNNLLSMSKEKPIMLVFLRHFGCVFCRDALRELSSLKSFFEEKEVDIVFVHMAEQVIAEEFFEKYELTNFESISDPSCELYNSFGLGKGNFNQLFGLKSLIRGFEASKHGTMISLKQIGDGFQMPGIFIISQGKIVASYIHQKAADKPNYKDLVNCAL